MEKQNSQRGYAFLIVAIAIFVVAMLGITVLAEYSMKSAQRKTDSTRMTRVYRAIVGDPSMDTFGYLGDVGDYPTTLQDLLQSPGATGWNGPYLSENLFSGSAINDSFGSPMEYSLNLTAGSSDELAIISKGPDHSSSNSASNPNDRTQFTGPYPSTGSTYTNASGNADNLAYPDFSASPATAVDYQNTGTLAYDLVNKDAGQASAILGACPLEYNVVVTSRTRGSSDTITLPYSPGLLSDFPQGLYDVAITSVQGMSAYFSEGIAIYPGRKIEHRLRVEDIDSTKTQTFTLTVTNNTAQNLNIKVNGTNTPGNPVNAGVQNKVMGSVKVCGTMTAVPTSGGAAIDTWVTPWGTNSTRVISSTNSTLTVTNANAGALAGRRQIQVYRDGVLLGTVYQRKSVAFTNIASGAAIVVKDQPGTTQIDSFTMPGAAIPKNY